MAEQNNARGCLPSWNPQHPARSAARSRGFAARAAFALLFDCIDAYTWEILGDPPIVQCDEDRAALRKAPNSTARFEDLAKLVGQKGGSAWALLNLGRAWRHRLVHARSDATEKFIKELLALKPKEVLRALSYT